MKIKMSIVVLLIVFVFALSGCGSNTKESPAGANEDNSVKQEEQEKTISVGLVLNQSGIDDKSFNQSTWEGLQKFEVDTNANVDYIQAASESDYVPNLSVYSEASKDLIVAPGFTLKDSVAEVAALFPEQKYLMIDEIVEADNVVSAVFSEEEGSFLVGVAAGMKTKEDGRDAVGFIGGMEYDIIQRFQAGFEAGVASVDPNITVYVEYVGSFGDAQQGQTLAAKMFDQGAYVIYHAAGGSGNGMIKEAKDRRSNNEIVWAIGVDKDQFEDGLYNDSESVVLTSMLKRVDVAAYNISEMVLNGEFVGGQTMKFDLSNNGVGIPEVNPNLSEAIMKVVESSKQKIIDGEIEVPAIPKNIQ